MKVFATLPPLHRERLLQIVAEHPLVDSVRFNTGTRVHLNPEEALENYLRICRGKEFWLDLKGRQLRITQWAVPGYGDIVLNHEIEVNLPAAIYFRGDEKSLVRKVNGNKIYIDPPPPKAVGAGQAINIVDPSLKIKGYFTPEDYEYLRAAKRLGIKNIMLSFVEEESEFFELSSFIPDANIIAKIESIKGLFFLQNIYPNLRVKPNLMAARDDLYINIGEDKTEIFNALELILRKDPNAVLASRILTSLEKSTEVSLSDLSDYKLMKSYGYKSLLLSDGISSDEKIFLNVMEVIGQLEKR